MRSFLIMWRPDSVDHRIDYWKRRKKKEKEHTIKGDEVEEVEEHIKGGEEEKRSKK